MNLLTIIGNAVADEEFLDRLFVEPIETVELYGFQLTIAEQKDLLHFTRGAKSTETKEYLRKAYICPKKPCHFALAKPRHGEEAATAERLKVVGEGRK
jgi:hypothetical protein